MSVSRKENGELKKKAGIGIIDNILNKFSKHAISNEAVSKEFEKIREEMAEMGRLRCAKFGTLSGLSTTGTVVDISSLNLSSSEDYMVILDGAGAVEVSGTERTVYISNKTATSFMVKTSGAYGQASVISYQVITFI